MMGRHAIRDVMRCDAIDDDMERKEGRKERYNNYIIILLHTHQQHYRLPLYIARLSYRRVNYFIRISPIIYRSLLY